MPEHVDRVIPGNPIYYDPRRVRRKQDSERRQRPPQEKRRRRETEPDQVDTYA
ncbi:MAG: hypothetical protein ISR91_06995 [Candidatus Delongbacteria bacterium]|nr:hypothetical protein [Candidatus Delongbacteria bacterium]